MSAWVFSTEPGAFPWSRVEADGTVRWDGIRGPLARKYLGAARRGERVWGYHSSPDKALVCLARTAGRAYPDPADPRWLAVDVRFERWLDAPIPLASLKAEGGLARWPFLRIPRLSVAPVSAAEEEILEKLAATSPRPAKGGTNDQEELMLKIGDKAPAFVAKDQDGKTVRLADFKGKSVVLYFYPKDMTPGCTVEACAFRDGHGALLKRGAVVLGVSKDGVDSHRKFADKHELPFPLLADEGLELIKAYGAWGEKKLYGKAYMGTLRVTYVIGPDGKIKAVFPKVKPEGHDREVLAAL